MPQRKLSLSLYFEDFTIGVEHVTRGRTITESDIVSFAGLSGDFVELHTNEEYARQSPYGRRIAHGLLTLSISSGLMVQMNLVGEVLSNEERVDFQPVIETPAGMAKIEVRIMYIWLDELRAVNTIVRMGQDGTVVAVRRIGIHGHPAFPLRLNGIATSPDGTRIWVTMTDRVLGGVVLELPSF